MQSTLPHPSRKTILIPCSTEPEYRRTMQTLSRFRLTGSRIIVLQDDGNEELSDIIEGHQPKRMEPVPEPPVPAWFPFVVGVGLGMFAVGMLWTVCG